MENGYLTSISPPGLGQSTVRGSKEIEELVFGIKVIILLAKQPPVLFFATYESIVGRLSEGGFE